MSFSRNPDTGSWRFHEIVLGLEGKMADDVLDEKLFNYVCGSGGFVELFVLLKHNSPLGSRKSEKEARNWLKNQTKFALVKDRNGEITGLRIDLRKKICYQYVLKGSCRRAKGECKYWHICKRFIEGKCDGVCGLSHNFHDEGNREKLKETRLEKYSNGALKNIVAWSLPKVCQLYLTNECKSDKCQYLHVCGEVVRGSSCYCGLSHNLTDSHNMKILKEYDLVPPRQVINVDFVRCSILVLDEQHAQFVGTSKSSNEGASAVTSETATATATARTVTSCKTPLKSRYSSGEAAIALFERLCKEFSCSASLTFLRDRKVVFRSELGDFFSMLEKNDDKFFVTRDERGNVQDVTAFCPKLRLCPDFVSLSVCKKKDCPHFHLCRKFITGTCSRGENCSRSHSFRNKIDGEKLLPLNLDGLTNGQLRQLMFSSSPQVCFDYNQGKCNRGMLCSRVHICKEFVTNACRSEDFCHLDHKEALDTPQATSLLEKYKLFETFNDKLKAILVCEEHDNGRSHGSKTGMSSSGGLPSKDGDFGEKWAVNAEPKQTPSSQNRKPEQQLRRSSVSSSCSSVNKFTPCMQDVFDCICKEYDGSVSFAIILRRQDLFPGNSEDIDTWFRERKERFRLSEDADGTILEVSSFCPKARLCFNYLSSTGCSRDDCQYFHVCREYIGGCCTFGSRCKWNHNFQIDQERKVISKLKLDGLTHEEIRRVLQLSMPQVCLDYNDGCCNRGRLCAQIHICKEFVKKRCEDEEYCSLQHGNALLTPHSTAVLETYTLKCTDGNVKFVLKELLVCDDSSRRRKESRGNSGSKPKMGALRGDGAPNHFKRQMPSAIKSSDSCDYNLPLTDQNIGLSKAKSSATIATRCWPTEQQVFKSLCTEYDCSAFFAVIANRGDLFPHGLESADSWFRGMKGSFLITECDKEKGKISQVEAFFTNARLCLDYIGDGACQNHGNCKYFHVCKDYITDTCSRGAGCPLNHHFHNNKDKVLLSRIKLDQLTEQQLRKLVLLSNPQLCVEYNNGICPRGASCHSIHMCCGYLRKCCTEAYRCGLDHEAALNTDHTQAVLERLQLSNVSNHDALKMILDDRLCLSSKEKTNCKYDLMK